MRALDLLPFLAIQVCTFVVPLYGDDRALQSTTTQVVGSVEKLLLYNAITDQPILTLKDGDVINVNTLNVTHFNIEAVTTTATGSYVGSIKFGYNGKKNFKTEAIPPYAFCGSHFTNYRKCSQLIVGQHNITATTYSGNKANGTVGTTYRLSFRIVDGFIPQPWTQTPTKAPVSVPKAPTSIPKAPTLSPVTSDKCSVIPKFNSSWERFTPDYPIIPSEAQAAMIGNDLFIFGSFTAKYTTATNHSYARDISGSNKNPWRRMDDMPVTIGITHAGLVVIGTKVYVCGGFAGPASGHHVDTCFVYDHSKLPGTTGQWSTFPSLPNTGSGGGAMLYDSVMNALFYTGGAQRTIGGSRHAKDVTNTWKYSFNDPLSGWVASTAIPYYANHQSSVTNRNMLGQEHHFVLGGQKGSNEITKNVQNVYEFIGSTETWIRRTFMPYGRSHATISTHAIGCGFIIAGGSINGEKLNRTSDIHYYHIPSDSWTLIGNLPIKAATPPLFLDGNNMMYYVDHRRTSRRQIYL